MGNSLEKSFQALKDEFLSTCAEIKSTDEAREQEIERVGGVASETAVKMAKLEERYDQVVADFKGQIEAVESQNEEFKSLIEQLEGRLEKRGSVELGEARTVRSILESEDAKEFRDWDPDKGSVQSPRLNFKTFENLVSENQLKAVTGGADLRDVLSRHVVQVIKGPPRLRRSHIRDYMNVVQLPGIGKVSYVEESGYVNAADFQTAEGAVKEESDIEFTLQNGNPVTLAHGVPISRQLARHVPALVNHIEGRLINGLYHKEDEKILFSDGSNGSYKGITMTPGIQQFSTHPRAYATGDTYIDTIRKARTLVEAAYLNPDLVTVNIFDWEAIELTKDKEERYIWTPMGVTEDGRPVMWRMPIYATTAMEVGEFVVGAFREAATLWETEGAFVTMFTQHADFPIRNMVLLLAELEEIFTIEVKEGFVHGTYAAGSGS